MVSTDALSNWLEIDLAAIAGNLRALQAQVGAQVMAVVKANGYGHGLIEVARQAVTAGAIYCGVARLDEALELRQAGVDTPIMVLGDTPVERFGQAASAGITLTAFRGEHLQALAALPHGHPVKVHLKIDTGMTRLGATPAEAIELLRGLASIKQVELEGMFTHYARADESDQQMTANQEAIFDELVAEAAALGMRPPLVHAANSAAALTRPSSAYDMVRPGIALYGLHPSPAVKLPPAFRPALTWQARLTQIRQVPAGTGISYGHVYVTPTDARLGVVPVGYGDGYRRESGNQVLLHGQLAPVRGRVCMDQLIVDLSELPQARVGDTVTLLGGDQGGRLAVEDLASSWGTINYEVVCGLSARVPRLYMGSRAAA